MHEELFDPTLIKEGRRLAERMKECQWELGDLALRAVPMGSHGGAHGGDTFLILGWFAYKIDVDFRTLYEYRWVASRWPAESRRLDMPWSVHQELASVDERFELIQSRGRWTARSAREASAAWRRANKSNENRDEMPTGFDVIDPLTLLPKDGLCPLCGVNHERWARLTRREAA